MLVFSYTQSSCTCAKPQTIQSVQTHHQSSSVTHWEGLTAATSGGLKLRASTWSHTHVPVPQTVCVLPSLPSAPGLATSKAPEPFSAPVAKQPTGLGREQTWQCEKCLQLPIYTARWKIKWVQPVCSLAASRSTSYNNPLHFRSGYWQTKVFLLQREAL